MPSAIVTARLRLRLLGPGDLDDVHSWFSSPGHTVGEGPITDLAVTRQWLRRRNERFVEFGLGWYGLWDARDAFVGNLRCFPKRSLRTGSRDRIRGGFESPGARLCARSGRGRHVSSPCGWPPSAVGNHPSCQRRIQPRR